MNVDWHAVINIAMPIITLFIGAWVNRRFENRPILISYYGHVSAFRTAQPGGPQLFVNTHSVVLRNTGRRSATNVRLRHNVLPEFTIWPALQHHVEDLPNNSGREVVIPTLVPGEEVTVSYLYFPPLLFNEINSGIRSDQGFAREIRVLLQRQYPHWFNASVVMLMLVGLISLCYLLFQAIVRVLR
jgi:hypothetical protein